MLQNIYDVLIPRGSNEIWMNLPFLNFSNIFVHDSKKLTPKASQFDLAINLAKPCPFTSLVGLISISYSSKVAIHLALLPLGSACVNMSLIAAEGTKTME